MEVVQTRKGRGGGEGWGGGGVGGGWAVWCIKGGAGLMRVATALSGVIGL